MKTIARDAVEHYTQAIGRELFEGARRDGDALFKSENVTSRLLNWSTRHEDSRLQLFRFVDVLPTLETDADVINHLREYFEGHPDPFSGLLRVGLGLAHTGTIAQKAVAVALRKGLEQIARTFIAAGTPAEAVARADGFRRDHQTFALDVLGEATLSAREADEYQRRYLELLEALTKSARRWERIPQIDEAPWGALPKVNLSVKLTALHPHFDPIAPDESIRVVKERLIPIARLAKERNAHLHIDVEEYAIKDLTFAAFKSLCEESDFEDYRHLGIVLQAYLKESYDDAERLVAWAKERGTPVTVRLVKGAYWDYETVHGRLEGWPIPVFTQKNRTDANFERITELFLENRDAIDLAIGSHNIRSVAHALAVARHMDLPQGTLEFQFLYGMASPMRNALTQMGERVRIYTPYGELIPGMAYLVRRLLENTSNESFLKKGFVEDQPIDVLLADPGLEKMEPGESHSDRKPRDGANSLDGLQLNGHTENGRAQEPLRTGPALGPGDFANQPHLDFSQASHRRAMAEALEAIRRRHLDQSYPLLIGEDEVQTKTSTPSVNPAAPKEVIGHAAVAGGDEAHQAIAAATKAFSDWRHRTPAKRREILEKAADLMSERRYQLAAWMVLEAGKPWREADGDVAEAVDFLRYYGRHAEELMRPTRMGAFTGEVNYYQREPRGVNVVIAPWNFPLAILTGMTAAALATGNVTILKPAEPTPVIAYHLVKILREAGVPPGAVNYLPGPGRSVGSALVEHPNVQTIAFTGSRTVGLSILATAAKVVEGQRDLKRVVSEMGGKNAIIVDSDADLDEAVQGVTVSAFGFAGQKCSACSRVIVHRSIYDAFVERLVAAAQSFPYGPPSRPEALMGPVITAEAQERIRGYIEEGRNEGTPLLVQDLPEALRETGGYFIPPTIYGDVPPNATIACEEIFGPVLSCMRAESFEHALDIAQDSEYALTGGVFSRSPGHVRQARETFKVGNLYINRKTTGALVGRQPFGGLRMSGVGFKAGGPDYLLQFVEARTITENTLRRGFASEDTAGN